jgi:nicotinamide mononucleotide (NMN) deamidase PncC
MLTIKLDHTDLVLFCPLGFQRARSEPSPRPMMRARQNSAGSDCNVNGAGPGGSSGNRSSEDVGEIHFSMKYDFQQNTFVVRVIEAKRLPAKDFSGFSGKLRLG